METRLNHRAASPQAQQAVGPLYTYVKECGLDIALIDMVWLRISQINGCAYCVDLHYRDALAHGVPARKLNSVVTWEETGFFSPRERAALAWAESLTLVAATHAPDAVYRAAHEQFADKELADLTWAIGLMNMMNRLGVGFRLRPEVKAEERGA
ncbi:MAG TPA: carboxymuconolactone decarboxylase family protein [Stellaceae bacterium]|nr:carboxymuconolactone decarboxylase family protein [Stellaceae bacterium]